MRRFYLAALLMILVPLSASALTTDARQSLFVDKEAVIEGVYVAAGGSLNLSGTFKDDVIVAGGSITVSGPIDGDLLVTGGTVKVTGEVKGNLRVVGGTVELQGKIGRNLNLIGGTLSTSNTSDVAGEVLLFGGTATLDGHVAGTLDAWSDSLTLNGKVDGHLKAFFSGDPDVGVPGLTVGSTAVIGGDLTYYSLTDAEIRSGAAITGKVTKNDPEGFNPEATETFRRFFTFARLWNLFSLLVVAALMVLVLPKTVRRGAELMMTRKGATIGWGLLIFLAGPVAFLLMSFTLIGIPLMIILAGVYALGLYVGQIFLGFLVGMWAIRLIRRDRNWQLGTKSSAALIPTFLGIALISLIFDFLLAGDILPAGLAFTVGLVRFLLVLWAFGGVLLVKAKYIKDHELT